MFIHIISGIDIVSAIGKIIIHTFGSIVVAVVIIMDTIDAWGIRLPSQLIFLWQLIWSLWIYY